MVLAFHGRSHSEADLRQLLGTSASGTPASSVLRVVPLGFEVLLIPSSVALLAASLEAGTPPIVFFETAALDYWQVDCAHVAVVVGLDDATVYLNDPYFETAPQRTSVATFQQAWAATGQLTAMIIPRP
jgi:ABC-type bacteriocin/lantibiotic exporter with double-glycine peptidase domain